ncbi:HD domain-containing protein [Streptomyces erythrochromogenes]|uniref:HD domain-containing protein n=1 Tax=Streptomyces erythrochromogenes TaxID=285574 RepID=UPI002253B5EF|nr:HD domain-containing protein [Streptomyces erythrochromogenes]MCX5582833.1 HD domain-containing protein [Streptomyces erythrochromogenes]
MELLHADRDDHALRTAALLRRSHPADKELQLAGLLHDIGRMLRPGDGARHAVLAAEAVRPLLGERVARLVRLHAPAAAGGGFDGADPPGEDAEAVATLRRAREAAGACGLDAGALEDWRALLELVAAGSCRARNAIGPLGSPRGPITGTQ